jgi:hypothetical protein
VVEENGRTTFSGFEPRVVRDGVTSGGYVHDPGSPSSPSFRDDALHPSVDSGLQHRFPALSLLSNESAVKENGNFLRLELLFRRGRDRCST